MANKISSIMEEPASQESTATWAIFYAITSTQDGLAGVDLGNMLIKRVVHELKQTLPSSHYFACEDVLFP